MLESNFSKDSGPICSNFIKKRLQHSCFPVKFAKFLRTPFLQNTSSGCFCVIRSTHVLWIKLICRDSGTGIFLWILRNFEKHYWPPPVAASFYHKMQNIKILWQLHAMGSLFPGKYSQWDNKFLPIVEAYLELVENLRWSLFAKIVND